MLRKTTPSTLSPGLLSSFLALHTYRPTSWGGRWGRKGGKGKGVGGRGRHLLLELFDREDAPGGVVAGAVVSQDEVLLDIPGIKECTGRSSLLLVTSGLTPSFLHYSPLLPFKFSHKRKQKRC